MVLSGAQEEEEEEEIHPGDVSSSLESPGASLSLTINKRKCLTVLCHAVKF